MIEKGISAKKLMKRNLISSQYQEFQNCPPSEIAKLLHHVITSSDYAFQDVLVIKDCPEKRVGPISRSSSIQQLIRKVVKFCAAMSVLTEINKEGSPGNWLSLDKYFASQLPATMIVLAAEEVKIMCKRGLINQIGGLKLNPRPCLDTEQVSLREEEAPDADETTSCTIRGFEEASKDSGGGGCLKDSIGFEARVSFRSISVIRRELPESSLGWPLLRRTKPPALENIRKSEARITSLVKWNSNEKNISSQQETDDSIVEECETEGTIIQFNNNYGNDSRNVNCCVEDEKFNPEQEISSDSDLVSTKESRQSSSGWPLLHTRISASLESSRESDVEELSVVQWVLSVPIRSKEATKTFQIDSDSKEAENYNENKACGYEDKHSETSLPAQAQLSEKLECILQSNSPGCKQFRYEELKKATHEFSSDNFLGEGGCSNVYKGHLPGGKLVAVKILKQYKEAWSDFYLEVDIMNSVKHKHITPLVGVCTEDNHLILVYVFLSKGSLEESIQGNSSNSVLPWKVRFKVAAAIAEALNHLHNKCSRPVIHRDVKSSNILLSNDLQPQLSDFGLAIWGPTDSAYATNCDVVGTFGYIAPEYFMHGRVSDKIDVYSFGIVLLELLTGKKPIIPKGLKGQESLVKWATPLLEGGNLKALLDPKMDRDFDVVQMQRMVLTATLCVRQKARLRPNMNQILELLRGEKDEIEWVNSYANYLKKSCNEEDDDLLPEIGFQPCEPASFLDSDDDSSPGSVDTAVSSSVDATSPLSAKRKSRLKLKDYLEEKQD